MHPEAFDYVANAVGAFGPFRRVVEFGSHDVNGSIRSCFKAEYVGVDPVPGPGVDVVADAAEWEGSDYDCVVCCEVFEHTDRWPAICDSAFRALNPKGVFIITCAGPGRGPHSAVDGNALRDGEYYANVEPGVLDQTLQAGGFTVIDLDQQGLDVRAVAQR